MLLLSWLQLLVIFSIDSSQNDFYVRVITGGYFKF